MQRVLVSIAFIILLAGAFYFSREKEQPIVPTEVFTVRTDILEVSEVREVPVGLQEYQSILYKFSLLYSQEFEVKEISEGEGAVTIVFQDVKEGKGFQIFILPYILAQVSEERFKKDIQSGVRTDSVDITIDGAIGASFVSKDATLGETREIWFINNNFLYEVTTLKPLETQLFEIMQTWSFI